MAQKSLTPEQMEKRVARFNKLESYQKQNFDAHNIPPGAVEKVTARRVYPVMAPADYQGRSAGAPVKGPRGLIVSIAECPPHNGPGLHRHLNTVENFFCLTGRFEISWGDNGEHKTVLEPNDMISVPRGENRMFFNISDEIGRLLVMIVPETDQQVDPIPTRRASARRSRTNTARRRWRDCRPSASSSRSRWADRARAQAQHGGSRQAHRRKFFASRQCSRRSGKCLKANRFRSGCSPRTPYRSNSEIASSCSSACSHSNSLSNSAARRFFSRANSFK